MSIRSALIRAALNTIFVVATRQAPGTRAKDSDRTGTCQVLDSALAEGQLSMTEHQQRVRTAMQAATLGELQALVSDLQNSNAPVRLPVLRNPIRLQLRGWQIRAAIAATLVLAGVLIGWGVYGNTSSPLDFTSDPGAKSDGIDPVVLTPPRQLHSLGGLTGLVEQMRQRFGDTLGYRLVVYPDRASLERPDPRDERRYLTYSYHGGWSDPTGGSPRSDDDVLVDLSEFDPRTVVGLIRGAPETVGIAAGDVDNVYLIIDPAAGSEASGELTLTVYVSSDYGSGYIEMAGDGTIKRINYP